MSQQPPNRPPTPEELAKFQQWRAMQTQQAQQTQQNARRPAPASPPLLTPTPSWWKRKLWILPFWAWLIIGILALAAVAPPPKQQAGRQAGNTAPARVAATTPDATVYAMWTRDAGGSSTAQAAPTTPPAPTSTPTGPDNVDTAAQMLADYNLGHAAPAGSIAPTKAALTQLLAKCSYTSANDVASHLISAHRDNNIAAQRGMGIKTFITQLASTISGKPDCDGAIGGYVAQLTTPPPAPPTAPLVIPTPAPVRDAGPLSPGDVSASRSNYAYMLTVLDGNSAPSSDDIRPYRGYLDSLTTKCRTASDKSISDFTVATQQEIQKLNQSATLLDLLKGVDSIVPPEIGENGDCADIYASILTLMKNGNPPAPVQSTNGNGAANLVQAAPAAAYHASASISDSSPHRNERVTVTGHLTDQSGHGVAGAAMDSQWNYSSVTREQPGGSTNSSGYASATRDISTAKSGFTVEVNVIFTLPDGRTATASTSFTPQ